MDAFNLIKSLMLFAEVAVNPKQPQYRENLHNLPLKVSFKKENGCLVVFNLGWSIPLWVYLRNDLQMGYSFISTDYCLDKEMLSFELTVGPQR